MVVAPASAVARRVLVEARSFFSAGPCACWFEVRRAKCSGGSSVPVHSRFLKRGTWWRFSHLLQVNVDTVDRRCVNGHSLRRPSYAAVEYENSVRWLKYHLRNAKHVWCICSQREKPTRTNPIPSSVPWPGFDHVPPAVLMMQIGRLLMESNERTALARSMNLRGSKWSRCSVDPQLNSIHGGPEA